jgi:hypothetical protein
MVRQPVSTTRIMQERELLYLPTRPGLMSTIHQLCNSEPVASGGSALKHDDGGGYFFRMMTRLPRLPIVTCTQQLVIIQGCSNRVHSQQQPCFVARPARMAGRACSSSSRNTKSRVPLIFLGNVISATPVLGSCSARARSAAAQQAAVLHI